MTIRQFAIWVMHVLLLRAAAIFFQSKSEAQQQAVSDLYDHVSIPPQSIWSIVTR